MARDQGQGPGPRAKGPGPRAKGQGTRDQGPGPRAKGCVSVGVGKWGLGVASEYSRNRPPPAPLCVCHRKTVCILLIVFVLQTGALVRYNDFPTFQTWSKDYGLEDFWDYFDIR